MSVFAVSNTDPNNPEPSDKVALVEYKSNVKLFYLKENEGKVKTTVTKEENGMNKVTKEQNGVEMSYYEWLV